MALVSNRVMTMQGRAYRTGETVDASLSSEKAQQLVGLRVIQDTTVSAPGRCVALRTLSLGGTVYQRGDLVDVRRLGSGKVSQLLDHRILDLAPIQATRSDASTARV